MAAAKKKNSVEIGNLIREVEALAKRLRTDIRKQTAALPKDLKLIAARFRKQAAHSAAQVEKYVHQVRLELEGTAKPKVAKPAARKAPVRKAPARKSTARKTV